MELKEQMIADMKVAMKEQDTIKRDILRVVIAEIARAEQTKEGKVTLTDTDIVRIIQKSCKNLEENIKLEGKNFFREKAELNILQYYLPKQLNEVEISQIIDGFISEMGSSEQKQMGKIISLFNSKYSGLADGKLVSSIVKSKLN